MLSTGWLEKEESRKEDNILSIIWFDDSGPLIPFTTLHSVSFSMEKCLLCCIVNHNPNFSRPACVGTNPI